MRLVFILIFLPLLTFAQNHLLITEVQTVPVDSSFIEIYNPTSNPIALDNVFLADHNTYYQIVENTFTNNAQDFLVQFPAGSSVPGKTAIVIALNGTAYEAKFGSAPDFEILGTSANAPDMTTHFVGASAQFNTHEMVILFQWDGNSDLVQDIDYIAWGLFTSTFIDKSGINIDGPDADSDSSSYLSDTPVSSQDALSALTNEAQSIQRIGISEGTETISGGNGLTGHDETSEDLSNQITLANPTPGIVQEVPGDGSGTVSVSPDSIDVSTSSTFEFAFTGENTYTLDKVQITVPATWTWSGLAGDVNISGDGFNGSSISVAGNDITIENTAITTSNTGTITVQNLTSPSQSENSIFTTKTAVAGGNLTEIQNSPYVAVWTTLTIADIQNNPALIGTTVSVEGIVTIGAGVLRTDMTDAYIQDNSGRGINIYRAGTPVDPNLNRGNKVQITGVVDEYNGTTEITNYTSQLISTNQLLPAPIILSTSTANDISLEGTYIQVKGIINDQYTAGGGTTIRINDGSGDLDIRSWDTANLNLGGYGIGDTISVKGVMDIYNGSAQILLSYQDEIEYTSLEVSADGSGLVSVTPDSIAAGNSDDFQFTLTGNHPDTLTTITLEIPGDWSWGGNFSLLGDLSGANSSANGNVITISGAQIKNNDSGIIEVTNLTAPQVGKISIFNVQTATANGTLTNIIQQPSVTVVGAAGTGLATVSPDSVGLSESIDLTFTIEGNSISQVSQIEITVPSYWTWAGNTGDVSTSGSPFINSNISVNANVVTISNTELINQSQGEIVLSNLTTPAVDTASTFYVKTGDASNLENIENQPIVMVGEGTQKTITPIDSIQLNPAYIGQTVTVKAVVSIGAGILRTDRTDAYIQDTTGYGLNVFSFDPPDENIVKGNQLLLTGLIEEYQGVTEITNYSYSILRKNSPIPGIKEISTYAAVSDATLEGSYVKVTGTIIDNYSAGGGTNIIIDDGSGEVYLRIWDTAQLDLSDFSVGDGIVAYGVLDIYNSAGQVMIGYQEDIQHIVLPRVPQFLKVEHKPFVPDRGERMAIRYSAGSEDTQTTMRIFDLSGRLITTLLDGSGRSFEQILLWNGRDELNDLVPLGTYIVHYEVVNNLTGKSWQKAAPIVVGTLLK